jgi:catechol 2,3-dioxygenase-like lactoylglutathione lyase family enzyme
MTTAKLNAFGLVVQDMAASLAFYRELGLEIPAEAESAPHVDVDLGGGVRIMFDPLAAAKQTEPDMVDAVGFRVALAFECGSPADVDALHTRLVSLGHRSRKDPWDAFWGQRYACLLDPDGNGVDLYAALPTAT